MDGMDDEYFVRVMQGFPNKLCSGSIKFWQNLALYRAGMVITCGKQMRSEEKYNKMMEAFQGHAMSLMNDSCMLKLILVGMVIENLLEATFQDYSVRTPVGNNVTTATPNKRITGENAWDRFLKIRGEVLNNIIPIWKSIVTNKDSLPSGNQLRDVLYQVLVR